MTGLNSMFWVCAKRRMASDVNRAKAAMTTTPPRYLPSRNWVRETGFESVKRMVPLRISEATAVLKMNRATMLPPNDAT